MYKGQSIAVIIPCLNEEQGIEQVLRAMPEFVDEIIVVDNNSRDGTAVRALKSGARVVHEPRQGYGNALQRGLAAARLPRALAISHALRLFSKPSVIRRS